MKNVEQDDNLIINSMKWYTPCIGDVIVLLHDSTWEFFFFNVVIYTFMFSSVTV